MFLLLNNEEVAGSGGDSITALALTGDTYTDLPAYSCITDLNGTDIAAADFTNDTISTLRWGGSSFSQVGNALSVTMANADGIVKLSSTRVCWIDHTSADLFAYGWDGTDWAQVGNMFDFTDMSGYANGTYLADNAIFIWAGNNAGIKYGQKVTFDGTDFVKVGNTLSLDGAYHMPIGMSENRIAVLSSSGDNVTAYDFDGTDWAQVGNAYTLPSVIVGKTGGCRLSDTEIVVWSGNNVLALEFDGTNFTAPASELDISATSWPRSMAAMGDSLFAAHYYGGSGNLKAISVTR